jgi:hypothetical protein
MMMVVHVCVEIAETILIVAIAVKKSVHSLSKGVHIMKKILLCSCVSAMLLLSSSSKVKVADIHCENIAKKYLLSYKTPKQPKAEVVEKSYSDDDLFWLSRVVSSEAKGEPLEGQIAVANVVLNRCRISSKSIKDIIFEKGQFQPVENKSIYDIPTDSAVEASIMALEGTKVIDDDVIHFYAPKLVSRGNSIRNTKIHRQIGNHIFSY